MTKIDQLVEKVSRMRDDERDRFVDMMLAEIESEEKWTRLFDSSQDVLKEMADEAVRQFELGQTKPLDPDAM
jgi:hypothetical protein